MNNNKVVVFLMALALCVGALFVSPAAGHAQGQGTSAVVTAAALNVRAGPGTGYRVVGVVRRGAELRVLESRDGWLHVSGPAEGWVSSYYVKQGAAVGSAPAGGQVGSGNSGKLLFSTGFDGGIYVMNADGSGLTLAAERGLDPRWSPDGQRIAFARWHLPNDGLYIMNADGGGAQRVLEGDMVRQPDWSPNGSKLAFSWQQHGVEQPYERCFFGGEFCFTQPQDLQWHLAVLDLKSEELWAPKDDLHSHSPIWLDNERLLFKGDTGLRVADTVNREQIPTTMLQNFQVYDPRRCSNGVVAVSFHQHDHWEIYRLGRSGGLEALTGSSSLLDKSKHNNVSPTWSPDCTRILFLSDRDGRWRPYIMNADGSDEQPFLPATFDKLRFDYYFNAERVFDWHE